MYVNFQGSARRRPHQPTVPEYLNGWTGDEDPGRERKKSTLRCEGLSGGRARGAVVERPPRVAGGRSVRQLVITYRIVANFQENLVLRYRYIKVAVA